MEKTPAACSNHLDGSCSIIFLNAPAPHRIEIPAEASISFVRFPDRCVSISIATVNMTCTCTTCICTSVSQSDMTRTILLITARQIMLLTELMPDRSMRATDAAVDVLYCYRINSWHWLHFFVTHRPSFSTSTSALREPLQSPWMRLTTGAPGGVGTHPFKLTWTLTFVSTCVNPQARHLWKVETYGPCNMILFVLLYWLLSVFALIRFLTQTGSWSMMAVVTQKSTQCRCKQVSSQIVPVFHMVLWISKVIRYQFIGHLECVIALTEDI